MSPSNNAQRKTKVIAIRQEVAASELPDDRKVILQDFLGGADRLHNAETVEEKIDSLISGTSDIISHLAREAVRSEKVVDNKIRICRESTRCNFGVPALIAFLATLGTVVGIAFKLWS